MSTTNIVKEGSKKLIGYISLLFFLIYSAIILKSYLNPLFNSSFTFNYFYFKLIILFLALSLIFSTVYHCYGSNDKKNKHIEYMQGGLFLNLLLLILSPIIVFAFFNNFIYVHNQTDNSFLILLLDSLTIPLSSAWITFAAALLSLKKFKDLSLILIANIIAGGIFAFITTFINPLTVDIKLFASILSIIFSNIICILLTIIILVKSIKQSSSNSIKVSRNVYFNFIKTGKWVILSGIALTFVALIYAYGYSLLETKNEIFSLVFTLILIYGALIMTPLYALNIISLPYLNDFYRNNKFSDIRKNAFIKSTVTIIYLFIITILFRIFSSDILAYFNIDINLEIIASNFDYIFAFTTILFISIALSLPMKSYIISSGKLYKLFASKVFNIIFFLVPVILLTSYNIISLSELNFLVFIALYSIIDLIIISLSYTHLVATQEKLEIEIMFKKYQKGSQNRSLG